MIILSKGQNFIIIFIGWCISYETEFMYLGLWNVLDNFGNQIKFPKGEKVFFFTQISVCKISNFKFWRWLMADDSESSI